jgi:hypothetical protein
VRLLLFAYLFEFVFMLEEKYFSLLFSSLEEFGFKSFVSSFSLHLLRCRFLTQQSRGEQIVSNPTRDASMMADLLAFKEKTDNVLRRALSGQASFHFLSFHFVIHFISCHFILHLNCLLSLFGLYVCLVCLPSRSVSFPVHSSKLQVEEFAFAQKEAFETFINKRGNIPAELLAKFLDSNV